MQVVLIIALFALFAIGWLIVKVCEFFGEIGSVISKNVKQKKILSDEKKRKIEEEEQKIVQEREIARHGELLHFVKIILPQNLKEGWWEKKIRLVSTDLEISSRSKQVPTVPQWTRAYFSPYERAHKRNVSEQMFVDDIGTILGQNDITWSEKEIDLINDACKYPYYSPESVKEELREISLLKAELDEASIEYDSSKISAEDFNKYFSNEIKKVNEYNRLRTRILSSIDILNQKIVQYNERAKDDFNMCAAANAGLAKKELVEFDKLASTYIEESKKQKAYFKKVFGGYKNGIKEDVIERLNFILADINLPACTPHTWDVDFDMAERTAIVEIGLPDVVHNPPLKEVEFKSGLVEKPLNQNEKKDIVPNIHPAIMLRVAYEIFKNDTAGVIKLLVLNGWIKFDDPSTGINTKAYTASLMVEKNQIINMNLKKIEPLVAFMNLKGKSAGKLVEIVPIIPVMNLDRKDSRFIATTEVLNKLGSETNLASMDWQDFESLIAELFEKEFIKEGAEVKVTQASRDRGVDAVIFDPDPIRGGKIIVQAKRYANTVDVSAVRDLCAVVKKEGAIKGILVTTSTFGGDAYKFANNEPVTLLNGAELLGLLKKHGYMFRINLEEARKLNLASVK